MISEEKVQLAHDTLGAIVLKEVDIEEFNGEAFQMAINVACGVLCWVLEHEHNDSFQQNLNTILKVMHDHGYHATPDDSKIEVSTKIYPAVEYNKALKDVEAMLVTKILETDHKEVYLTLLENIKAMRK